MFAFSLVLIHDMARWLNLADGERKFGEQSTDIIFRSRARGMISK